MAQAQPVRSEGGFPPQPWRLAGEAWLLAWRVREAELSAPWPAGFHPLRLGGRLLVGAVWAIYRPGGDLAYQELAIGVVGREGLRPAVTIPWIWVDDPAALAGGRALWAIPKQIGSFEAHAAGPAARDAAGAPIAALAEAGGVALPGRWRLPLPLVQPSGPALVFPKGAARGVVLVTRARWRFAPAGPLGWLSNATPLVSGRLDGARLVFGAGDPDLGP